MGAVEHACDVEVDVNGEETFFVNKTILSSFSGRLSKLFHTSSASTTTSTLRVIFHELPGGPEAFELAMIFCYNNGVIDITPINICLLHCVAQFMEMTSLADHTEKFLEGISYWTWSEILFVLKQCEDFIISANSSGILQKCLDSLVTRIASASDSSPSNSSPENNGVRFSCDTRSTESQRTTTNRVWWFEGLSVLNPAVIEKVVKAMISGKISHMNISKFLLYYLKVRSTVELPSEKSKITETVIDLLSLLNKSSVSSKGLFGVLRISSHLDTSKDCRNRLESMIGSRIDEAMLDNLLVPAPTGMGMLYDVNLILRFLKYFFNNGDQVPSTRLKRVGSLIDMYLAEVAPDSCLKPLKFIALATALPDLARDTHNGIYQAIDMYLEVHGGLSEEEKTKICSALNHEKLSSEACKHLAQNAKFPSRIAIQALVSQQTKLKSLLKDTGVFNPLYGKVPVKGEENEGQQIVLYAEKLDISMENEKLKANLQGMQWRVMELEKLCKKMHAQMTKMRKNKSTYHSGARSLPRLCS
ncbi:BTB/POZ domain-containing protein [Acorus gramineus]|uniref:BTB/POZ domain-containing protein n=1 Tax=Acorus gramineus TaxID=55184 RepID=A0AAV9BVH3_ACOGR|nr:BTB/POZ domain-containing protein [Acorus gramineus]